MPRTLFIHIGLPKTGSTAIQNFCRDNVGLLAEHGIHWSKAGTERHAHNHAGLVTAFLKRPAHAPPLTRLKSELAGAEWPERVLISAETFAARLDNPGYLEAVETFSRGIGYEPHFIAYLRPQPAAINSLFTQRVKTWRPVPAMQEFVSQALANPLFDYAKLLSPAVQSARSTLTVRRYDRQTAGPGLIADFLSLLGIDCQLPSAEIRNLSPGPKTIAAFTAIRNLSPLVSQRELAPFARPLIMAADALGWNRQKYYGITPTDHERICSQFENSNDAIARWAWGSSWREAFPDSDLAPATPNIFDPELAAPEEKRGFDRFVGEALETIRELRSS